MSHALQASGELRRNSALGRLADGLSALLVALLLVFLQFRSGIDSYVITVAVMAVFAYVTVAGGRLLLAAAGERDAGPSAAWALGLP